MSSQEMNVGAVVTVHPTKELFDNRNEVIENSIRDYNFITTKDGNGKSGIVVNGESIQKGTISNGKYVPKSLFFNDKLSENESVVHKNSQNGLTRKEHFTPKASTVNGKHAPTVSRVNGEHAPTMSRVNAEHAQTGSIENGERAPNGSIVNGDGAQNGSIANETLNVNKNCTAENKDYSYSRFQEKAKIDYPLLSSVNQTDLKRPHNSVVVTSKLTAAVLKDLFEDQICVLHIPNYVPQVVCDKLDRFFRDRGSDQYTHEIRKDGRADLLYFGVNRYGFPLNSTYNDDTGRSIQRYFSEALPTIQSIRSAASPHLSPIDKLRVELDETWHKNVNVATLNGQKTFCGIGRIMPASLSELSADQPHFDAVPTTYFPDIHKQFAANVYLNVPEEGGELEIWDVPPVDVENVENFTIPEDWRSKLPPSIKVKPGAGDLLMLNTRRPHAVTKFSGDKPRTSIQSFIGLTKESDVFLWV